MPELAEVEHSRRLWDAGIGLKVEEVLVRRRTVGWACTWAWRADEILWRARLHPSRRGGDLDAGDARTLWRGTRDVCRRAIDVVDHNWEYPETWLFAHRWEKGGRCPRCRTELQRADVGGRTTCWCPRCQPALHCGVRLCKNNPTNQVLKLTEGHQV